MLKSVLVVLGSYILSVILVFGTNPVLSHAFPGEFAPGHVPSNAALLTSTALFAIISIVCAWTCARFASAPAQREVLWFFLLGEVLGIAFTSANWSNGWPHWYGLSWLVVWPVGCWIGLKLSGRSTTANVVV